MTNFAEIRTFDATTSDTTTYGIAVDASWGGHTKNGYITLHVLKGPDEYPAKGAVSLGWRMLEPLLKVIVERQIGRELMADALRGQRLKVVDDWTDEDEAALVADKKREAEEKVALAEYRKRSEEAQQERARQDAIAQATEAVRKEAQKGRNREILEAINAAGGKPVLAEFEFEVSDGRRLKAVELTTHTSGTAQSLIGGFMRELGLKQREFMVVCVTLAGKRPGA
ncbi:hypothetical protein [Mesorhizobium sp. M0767]|uniref:hypothetical protein n=1 Tax=Mesorhizobium sp. M0767 TaxID=2956995 RepID=UPI00333C527C